MTHMKENFMNVLLDVVLLVRQLISWANPLFDYQIMWRPLCDHLIVYVTLCGQSYNVPELDK